MFKSILQDAMGISATMKDGVNSNIAWLGTSGIINGCIAGNLSDEDRTLFQKLIARNIYIKQADKRLSTTSVLELRTSDPEREPYDEEGVEALQEIGYSKKDITRASNAAHQYNLMRSQATQRDIAANQEVITKELNLAFAKTNVTSDTWLFDKLPENVQEVIAQRLLNKVGKRESTLVGLVSSGRINVMLGVAEIERVQNFKELHLKHAA